MSLGATELWKLDPEGAVVHFWTTGYLLTSGLKQPTGKILDAAARKHRNVMLRELDDAEA